VGCLDYGVCERRWFGPACTNFPVSAGIVTCEGSSMALRVSVPVAEGLIKAWRRPGVAV